MTSVTLHIKKEAYKFSAGHMTVFPDGTKESLHGHNYEVELLLTLREVLFDKLTPFSELKKILKHLSGTWDEKILIAEKNPYFKLTRETANEIEFSLCEKRYVLPRDEVVLLNCDNLTTENLSLLYLNGFLERLSDRFKKNIRKVEIRITEFKEQGSLASYEFEP